MTKGAETQFGERLAKRLRPLISTRYHVATKRSLLYSVNFGDDGELHLGQNDDDEPIRGGGTGFEQDLLVYEQIPRPPNHTGGFTTIIPRVTVELKFQRITTHDSIVYSEKARRIRTIYPFVRYGLILGGVRSIPPRTLRLGAEFDFIIATPEHMTGRLVTRIANLIRLELRLSKRMSEVLRGLRRIAFLHRQTRHNASF